MNKIAYYLTTFFGLGKAVKAPGTFGSLIGLMLWMAIDVAFPSKNFIYISIILLISFGISVKFCSQYISNLHQKDPSEVIIDEIIAQLLVLFATQNITNQLIYQNVFDSSLLYSYHIFISFIAFRFFDIMKPFFIKNIEKSFDKGFGIMIDDIIAAIYAILSIYLFSSLLF
ncbi:phosphatidylglycerophosphatase A [Flavobacteriaceae bacterium]|nr:phosphatidylglycerophosphatase A [Flavobacteriaceae bacterium]